MQKFINNWSTTLTQSITASDTIIQVDINAASQLAAGFQQGDYYLLTIDDGVNVEIVKALAVNGAQLEIERAQEDTVAISWPVGALIEARVTAGALKELKFDSSTILTASGEILVSPNGNIIVNSLKG